MERKIGEIFSIDNEWYEVVKSNGQGCKVCAFYEKRYNKAKYADVGSCGTSREDCTPVIFKKLEKVGKPIEYNGSFYQGYRAIDTAIDVCKLCVFSEISCGEAVICDKGVFYVGIKQNKEDMEEKELNLKEFNLEAAKSGKPVYTRDGRKARIVCFDAKGDQPIIALVEAKGNKDALIEKVERYFINGHSVFEVRETNNDLMMLPEKKEGWVNVYRDCDGANITKDDNIYSSKDAAIASAQIIDGDNYIATTKIKWEE